MPVATPPGWNPHLAGMAISAIFPPDQRDSTPSNNAGLQRSSEPAPQSPSLSTIAMGMTSSTARLVPSQSDVVRRSRATAGMAGIDGAATGDGYAYVAEYRIDGRLGPRQSPVAAVEQDWFFARDVSALLIIPATALLCGITHGRSERA
ncbi:uncharacterized protein ATNIH1004_002057, partial [Aspergillus tanneri]